MARTTDTERLDAVPASTNNDANREHFRAVQRVSPMLIRGLEAQKANLRVVLKRYARRRRKTGSRIFTAARWKTARRSELTTWLSLSSQPNFLFLDRRLMPPFAQVLSADSWATKSFSFRTSASAPSVLSISPTGRRSSPPS